MSIIRELHRQLVNKERSAVEITQDYLNRIEAVDPQTQCFLTVTADRALAHAQNVDQRIASGEEIGPLAGIPLAIKDNLCTEGIPTTCASKVLENFTPPYESTVTQRLQAAGAVILGKANLDEFAMGSSTENSAYQLTANPWRLERVPGGSSGGSAAAVAANECVAALGSDTGGSIRQPASFCGVVGVKPTYGLVSRYGLVAFASSLDQIGPLATCVEDAAMLLQGIAGYDPRDSTSLKVNIPDYAKGLRPSLDRRSKRRIGVIKETFGRGLDPIVEATVEKAIAHLQDLGAAIEVVSCPQFRYGVPTYYIIAPSEASSNLARYDGVKYGVRREDSNLMAMYTKTRAEGFGPEVKRRIMIGTYALSAGYYDAYYLKAQKVRTLIKRDFERAFGHVDVLVCPTVPTTAYLAGEKSDDPLSMYLGDLMTIPANLAGLPAMSLPCGFDDDGMPIGIQLIGNVLREDLLFEVGYAYEQSTDWHKRKPKLASNK